MVVADHKSPTISEHPTEALLPPEHRPADAHPTQNRRVHRIAEGLRAEPDPISLDHSLRHFTPPAALPDLFGLVRIDRLADGSRARPVDVNGDACRVRRRFDELEVQRGGQVLEQW